MEKMWYTIEDITYDKELHKISGMCVDGPYIGEVEIYLPNFIDGSILVDGCDVKALCGPGMTMSLPPQIMGCEAVEIIDTIDENEMVLDKETL